MTEPPVSPPPDDEGQADDVLQVVVNGRSAQVVAGMTLASWLEDQGRDARTVAIERNGEIVPRAEFRRVAICQGDRLEVVQFVQGG